MKVNNTLCNDFQEVINQRCLAIELDKIGLEYLREEEMPIYYENIQVGTRWPDFIVADKVLVGLKALINWKMSIWPRV